MPPTLAVRLSPAWRTTLLVVALLFAMASGATAKATYDATNARNADKVDGRHAVSAGSSVAARRGRLVATSPRTGRLPDNIIGTAPRARVANDAARLGGVTARSLRRLTFPATSGSIIGPGASLFIGGMILDPSQIGTLSWTVVLPADRRTGSPLVAEILFQENTEFEDCSWFVSTDGVVDSGGTYVGATWHVLGSSTSFGPVLIPADPSNAHRVAFRLADTGVGSGSLVTFTLTREGGQLADTCGDVYVRGIQFLY